jgi:hypothetical protein
MVFGNGILREKQGDADARLKRVSRFVGMLVHH